MIGISFYVVFLCTVGSVVIGLQGDFTQEELLRFVLLMFIGINAILALAAFIILYRKKGLENESNMAETIVISDNMIKKRRLRNHIGYAVFGV